MSGYGGNQLRRCLLTNVVNVLLHPRQVSKGGFVSRWNYGNVARAIVGWLRVDSQNHLLIGVPINASYRFGDPETGVLFIARM